eukprot:6182645-Pleurochrysis_carterae.AAC.1
MCMSAMVTGFVGLHCAQRLVAGATTPPQVAKTLRMPKRRDVQDHVSLGVEPKREGTNDKVAQDARALLRKPLVDERQIVAEKS